MANMSYCRFQNTYLDLLDCANNLGDKDLSDSEKMARKNLLELCKEMIFADLKRVRDEKYSMNNHKKSVEALVHGENGFLNWYEQNYL